MKERGNQRHYKRSTKQMNCIQVEKLILGMNQVVKNGWTQSLNI